MLLVAYLRAWKVSFQKFSQKQIKNKIPLSALFISAIKKWHQNNQNSIGAKNHRQVVTLQSFKHFDVIPMIN